MCFDGRVPLPWHRTGTVGAGARPGCWGGASGGRSPPKSMMGSQSRRHLSCSRLAVLLQLGTSLLRIFPFASPFRGHQWFAGSALQALAEGGLWTPRPLGWFPSWLLARAPNLLGCVSARVFLPHAGAPMLGWPCPRPWCFPQHSWGARSQLRCRARANRVPCLSFPNLLPHRFGLPLAWGTQIPRGPCLLVRDLPSGIPPAPDTGPG